MPGECKESTHKQGDSFPLGLTLEVPEELLELIAMWTVPREQLSTEHQGAGLWMAIPKWMDKILFESLPLWSKKVKTDQQGVLNFMQFS